MFWALAAIAMASAKPDDSFVKQGLVRYRSPLFQYPIIGLGGTVLRAGADGVGAAAPGIASPHAPPGGGLEHLPYLAYQYWWDQDGHRHYPFALRVGYGPSMAAGTVTSYRQRLDIETGLLVTELGLKQAGRQWSSSRELFVSPRGVLVIRITDSPGAPAPIRLAVTPNSNVRLYHNGGMYDRPHPPWTAGAGPETGGMLIEATRPRSCRATLAVASRSAIITPGCLEAAAGRGGALTLFIAPGSSYEPTGPNAWERAHSASLRGFAAELGSTAAWWRRYHERSSVTVPDSTLARWYRRSLYYHGVHFGNTDVPPGCNGAGPLFSGAVCPEYDLVLNHMALLATGHMDEAKRLAGWLGRILPRAERYGAEGMKLHGVTVTVPGAALYGPLIGYDGTVPTPPTEGEGIWAYERYPGANAAAMALAYADWSGDASALPIALRILKGVTAASVAQLEWRPDLAGYSDSHMGNSLQLAAADYCLRQSVQRGVAEPGWLAMAGKIARPTAEYKGHPVIVTGPGFAPTEGSGDAPWLADLWWYGNLRAEDPLARSTYDMVAASRTGNYVFNNGWMAVYAARLGLGEDAAQWLHRLIRPGVTLHDDTCLGEIVYGEDDLRKTPEIAAHGALVCGLAAMLVDGDDPDLISLFPALPALWARKDVAFTGLATRSGLQVSARVGPSGIQVTLRNPRDRTVRCRLRVRQPEGWGKSEGGWVTLEPVQLAPGGTARRHLAPGGTARRRLAPRRP